MSDFVLFEEGGNFRAAMIQSDQNTSLQVELPGGKRQKLKSAQVLLRFKDPVPAQLLPMAEPIALEMDPAFLWECAPDNEFTVADLATEYYGHAPSAIESTALLLGMHNAPMYFIDGARACFAERHPTS